ncbi:MAG: hypothetical protein JWO77_2867 [Ilumatobacteraceae bacterium]|nr:hypothetical protein [Ilumatobacteraceae bacterium]
MLRPKRYFERMEKIQRATEHLTDDCMRRKGLRYGGVAQLIDPIQGGLPPDLEYRAAQGYGFAHTLRPIWEPPDAEADDWYLAYSGGEGERVKWKTIASSGSIAGGGCFGEARRKVSGSVLDWVWARSAEQDYWLIVAKVIEFDDRFPAARAAWSTCMAERGHPRFQGPMQPWVRAREKIFSEHERIGRVTEQMRADEIELATADAECEISSGMVDLDRTIREEFLAQAPPQYLRDIKRIADAQTEALQTIEREGLDP